MRVNKRRSQLHVICYTGAVQIRTRQNYDTSSRLQILWLNCSGIISIASRLNFMMDRQTDTTSVFSFYVVIFCQELVIMANTSVMCFWYFPKIFQTVDCSLQLAATSFAWSRELSLKDTREILYLVFFKYVKNFSFL